MGLPSFVLALALGVLAIKTGWLPFGGLTSPMHAQLPFFAQVWDMALHLALPTIVLTLLSLIPIPSLNSVLNIGEIGERFHPRCISLYPA
jgi:peptide/nickel transport system permease protein